LAIPTDFSDVPSARAASREVANEWDRWKAPRSSGLRIVADNELLDFAEPSNDSKLVSEEAMEPEPTNVAPSNSSTDDNQSDLALIEARLMALSEQLSDIQEVVDSKDLEIARLKAELAERPVRGVTPTAASDTEPAPASQAASEGGSSLISGLFWFILAAGLIAIGWFNRHRLTPNERGRDEKADISAPSALSGGLDELLPVPSQLGSQPDNEPATGPERGYGESLLTGYAADQTLADAVAEADIYVAYGRHQHALDTLEAASAAEPSNASGLLKMLDIYMSLDRIDEATGLLVLIEGTGDTVALESAKSRLDSHQASLSGDDAAHELASLDNAEPEVEASDDTLDISLDLEFQEAAKPAPEDAEADASGALDAEDPAETALDLALAYIDMGDKAGAADLLQTVLSSGDEAQREHAQSLLDSLE
jgi:pilus assembly protein FimV